jgi:hypothetical protein
MSKTYSITVGGKTYSITIPSFLGGGQSTVNKDNAPFSAKRAADDIKGRRNQLDELDRQLKDVGKTEMEKEVFDD